MFHNNTYFVNVFIILFAALFMYLRDISVFLFLCDFLNNHVIYYRTPVYCHLAFLI